MSAVPSVSMKVGATQLIRTLSLAPLDREALGHMRDRGFAEAVDGLTRQRDGARLRPHVDDRAALARQHVLAGVLGEEERRLHVEVEDEIIVGLDKGLDRPLVDTAAGVVDEDVELAEGGDGRIDRRVALLEVEHVHLQRQGLAALGLDLR